MKTLNAAELIDIAGIVFSIVMLAYLALLFIRFIRKYMEVCERHYVVYRQADFNCTYAQKRLVNRVVHDCKYAVFPINPDGRAGLSGK